MVKGLIASRPMRARDTDEAHRAATPLELLFDLVSVIAIAAAAAALHHAIAEAHITEGLIDFAAAFFMIWWAWMNYTWFASAYDNDDTVFRLLTMVSMGGALTIAAGIKDFFEANDLFVVLIGFVVMRLVMVAFWLRAAQHDPSRRTTALWYAGGIALVQCYWVTIVLNQPASAGLFYILFALGAVLELTVPALAERQGMTAWHRHHVIERYGLLNIIVLGETLLAASMALEQAAGSHGGFALITIAASALAILFSMWWLYFSQEEHLQEQSRAMAFTWGYGHVLIYMAGAAVGSGFAVLVDIVTGHAHVGLLVGEYAVAIPVAVYLLGLWFVRDRFALNGSRRHVLPIFGVLIVAAPLLLGLEAVVALTVLSVYVRSRVLQ